MTSSPEHKNAEARMIAIVDNGESYSSHTIYFVRVPEWATRGDVDAIAKVRGHDIVGFVEAVEWRARPPEELWDHITPWHLLDSYGDDARLEHRAEDAPREVIAALLPHWRTDALRRPVHDWLCAMEKLLASGAFKTRAELAQRAAP